MNICKLCGGQLDEMENCTACLKPHVGREYSTRNHKPRKINKNHPVKDECGTLPELEIHPSQWPDGPMKAVALRFQRIAEGGNEIAEVKTALKYKTRAFKWAIANCKLCKGSARCDQCKNAKDALEFGKEITP